MNGQERILKTFSVQKVAFVMLVSVRDSKVSKEFVSVESEVSRTLEGPNYCQDKVTLHYLVKH